MSSQEIRKVDDKIQRRFEKFDRENPRIYELYKRFAFELKERGRNRYGIKMLTERIRWEIAITTQGDDFKINNNFTSRYARKLIEDFPDFAGMFQIRRLMARQYELVG